MWPNILRPCKWQHYCETWRDLRRVLRVYRPNCLSQPPKEGTSMGGQTWCLPKWPYQARAADRGAGGTKAPREVPTSHPITGLPAAGQKLASPARQIPKGDCPSFSPASPTSSRITFPLRITARWWWLLSTACSFSLAWALSPVCICL